MMMITTRTCVGGRPGRPCVIFGQHATDCHDETCRGCLPRPGTQGWLCDTCDTHLRQWLAVTKTPEGEWRPNSLLWVHGWLGLAQSVRRKAAPQFDHIVTCRDDLPSPVSEAIMDCRRRIEAIVAAAEEWAREKLDGVSAADLGRVDLVESVAYLARRVVSIEDSRSLVGALYDDTQDVMIEAHSLAPWRAERKRIAGIPCPGCERVTMTLFGGDDFVTCTTCQTVVASRRFDIWTEMLRESA